MNVRAPSFPWSISFGNVLQIATTLLVVAGAFFTVDHRTQANARAIEMLTTTRETLTQQFRADIIDIENRLRMLEQKDARNDERLTNMLALLSRIDSRLERLEERLP